MELVSMSFIPTLRGRGEGARTTQTKRNYTKDGRTKGVKGTRGLCRVEEGVEHWSSRVVNGTLEAGSS